MPTMNDVKFGLNKYCGPAVLSIVTGKSTDECANAIAFITRKYEVTGVYMKDLKAAAERLGFKLTETPFVGRSMYSAIVSISDLDGVYIVELSKHYVCIEIVNHMVWFNDNHTKEPMPAASSARLMNGVVSIHRVEMKPKPQVRPPKYSTEKYIKVRCDDCLAFTTFPCDTEATPEEMEKAIRHNSNCEQRRIIQ